MWLICHCKIVNVRTRSTIGCSISKHYKNGGMQLLFAEDLVPCAMTREEVEEDLGSWRVVFERHGLKISRTKTE